MMRVDQITEGSRMKWLENRSNIESAARFEKTLVMNYLLKMHGLGAAAPGELPGECCWLWDLWLCVQPYRILPKRCCRQRC